MTNNPICTYGVTYGQQSCTRSKFLKHVSDFLTQVPGMLLYKFLAPNRTQHANDRNFCKVWLTGCIYGWCHLSYLLLLALFAVQVYKKLAWTCIKFLHLLKFLVQDCWASVTPTANAVYSFQLLIKISLWIVCTMDTLNRLGNSSACC